MPDLRIPRKIHFIWGYHPDSRFGVVERLAILSAVRRNPEWVPTLWSPREPAGNDWATLSEQVPTLTLQAPPPLGEIHPSPEGLTRYQHKADVLRHWIMLRQGGAYLDLDTVTFAPFEALDVDAHEYTVGLEYGQDGHVIGLPNCAFFCRPFAEFARKVYSEMRTFRTAEHHYAEFAVYRPYRWAQALNSVRPASSPAVNIVAGALLGPMHWDIDEYWGVGPATQLHGVVVAHLWRTNHSAPHLDSLTEDKLRHGNFRLALAVQAARLLD